LEGGVG